MENPGSAMNLEKPVSVTTAHHINVDGKVVEPINGQQNVIYVDGQPLVALRQVSEALGYKVAWDEPTKTALVDMNIATLAIQPDSAEVVRHGKLKIINLDTSESFLPAARKGRWYYLCKTSSIQIIIERCKNYKGRNLHRPSTRTISIYYKYRGNSTRMNSTHSCHHLKMM